MFLSSSFRGYLVWIHVWILLSGLGICAQPTDKVTRFTPYRFNVGQFECTVLYDGYIEFDDIALFFQGASEEQLKQKLTEYGIHEKLEIGCQFLLVNTGTELVMIDTGFGTIPDDMPFPCQAGFLAVQLKKINVDPNDIDVVILSHWHMDHVGGAVNAKGKPMFPKAKVYMHRADWEAGKDMGDVFPTDRLLPLQNQITLIDDKTDILPGIRAIPCPGHTPGHLIVEITSNQQKTLHLSDMIIHPIHLECPNWTMGYETDPNQAVKMRHRFLTQAASENVLLFACHMPYPGLGTIKPDKTGWTWVPHTAFTRQRNVIYGHKHGMALTMDVFTPAKAKGIGILWVLSSSGRSSIEKIEKPSYQTCFHTLLHKGYTVFAVVHSSAPRFTLQDMVPDIRRAVRYVRYHAKEFGIDADRIGMAGASAGGTLALLMGTSGQQGNTDHTDPVERVSSGVKAVGCFFGPSDWLDFDGKGTDARTFQKNTYGIVDSSFLFYELDPNQHTCYLITDEQKILSLLKAYSPIAHVTQNDAPTLIIHGDADPFIPLQQSQRLVKALKEKNVPCQLITRPGKGHGWDGWENDTSLIADWFDKHL